MKGGNDAPAIPSDPLTRNVISALNVITMWFPWYSTCKYSEDPISGTVYKWDPYVNGSRWNQNSQYHTKCNSWVGCLCKWDTRVCTKGAQFIESSLYQNIVHLDNELSRGAYCFYSSLQSHKASLQSAKSLQIITGHLHKHKRTSRG